MKSLRNQVQLIGRLGADPEMREFSNGNNKVSISLATSDFYKNKAGEQVTDTPSGIMSLHRMAQANTYKSI